MDKHLQVKICDFGLSKTKDHTQTYQGTNGTGKKHQRKWLYTVADLSELINYFCCSGLHGP